MLLLLTALPTAADTRGKVVGVLDGDTLKLRDVHRVTHVVHLNCIDAPAPEDAYGPEAKAHLSGLVTGRIVTVVNQSTDDQGRLMGHVELRGDSINVRMVSDGFARSSQNAGCSDTFDDAEQDARSAGRGLWVDKTDTNNAAL